jgi:hypothetical protein
VYTLKFHAGSGGKREGVEGKGGARGKQRVMTQSLHAHMNKRNKKRYYSEIISDIKNS